MLLDVIHYSGIYAKISALKADFLTHEDYLRLASQESVKDLVQILGEKKTYEESVLEASAHGTNRVALERSLFRALYRDYTAIFSFLARENERKYLDVIFLKYEISLIKRMLRRLFDQRDIQNVIPKSDKFLSRRLKLDVEKLGGCSTFEEFMDTINGTEFYDVLSKVNKEKGTLFDYEMQLDFYQYIKTKKYKDKYLDSKSAQSQMHILGSESDLLNVMWIHRAKTYYQIDNDRIFAYLLPINYRLKTKEVKDLVASDNSDFLNILNKTFYRDVFADLEAEHIDMYYNNYMNAQYNKEVRKNPYSLASVTWHLYYKMQEIKNITTLTECVRYKLPPSVTMKKLNIGLSKVGDNFD